MKHLLLLLLTSYALCGSAQTDPQGVFYIVVRKPKPAPARRVAAPSPPPTPQTAPAAPLLEPPIALPQAPAPLPVSPAPATLPDLPPPAIADPAHDVRDVFRARQAERIFLQIPENKAIAHLGKVLLIGLQNGHFRGFLPDDFCKGYGAAHLQHDLATFAQAIGENGPSHDQWCSQMVDITGEMVVNQASARAQFRPRYVHLLWRHPDLARGECLLTIIPWEEVRPYLAGIAALPPFEQLSLAEMIETHQYEGIKLHTDKKWLFQISEIMNSQE